MGVKQSGLSATERRSMLAEALGDGDGEVDETSTAPSAPSAPPASTPAPPVAAAFPVTADMVAFATALGQSIVAGLQPAQPQGQTRDPIPEVAVSPDTGIYGNNDQPRTQLPCPYYMGIYDDEGRVTEAFEIFADTCKESERVELLKLAARPGVYPRIERADGASASWRIVVRRDENNLPVKVIIAVPSPWLGRDQFQQMPTQPNFLRQLVEASEKQKPVA